MATFEKLRISLARGEVPPLIQRSGAEEEFRSRVDFLSAVFAQRHDFLRGKTKRRLSFVPIEAPKGYLAGFFGKEGTTTRTAGPETNFHKISEEDWPVALFVMQTAADSQIAWMERNRLGSPKEVLESLFADLGRRGTFSDWKVFIEYMDRKEVYWEVIQRYRQEITQISFTFIPPNALNASGKIMDFIREVKKQSNPDTVTHTYRGDPGQIDAEGDLLKASAEIAMDGGGEASVRVGKREVYSSSKAKITSDVPEEEMPTVEQPTFVRRVIDRLFNM